MNRKINTNEVSAAAAAPEGAPVINPNRIFYWAYGSNLCRRQMRKRCPRAKYYGPMDVQDCALVFRGVADITVRKGSVTPGGLYQITRHCEEALDAYEGVAQRKYMKRYFLVKIDGKSYTCLFYQMRTSRGIMPPTEGYLNTIAEGYYDFGLPYGPLEAALHESWGNKEITPALAERRERQGQVPLARPAAPELDVPTGHEEYTDEELAEMLEHTPSHLLPPMWGG